MRRELHQNRIPRNTPVFVRNAPWLFNTPFGLFNGPDCYNSHLAGDLAHWTQVQLWDRRVYTPMNPAVAWHHFALAKLL